MSDGAYHRWAVLGVIMLATFMAVLDTSIVNVALPHMMGAFGVNRDQIEWVSTAFLLASAGVMPLIGWFTNRFDYKAIFLYCLLLFTVASVACAMAWSFESLIAARVAQALGGGAIQPLGMAIVAELFEPRERGRALGVWGTGVMVAPALGPTLGGYLTDHFSWRTIFSVNLPIGVVTLLLGVLIMRRLKASGARRDFDWGGFVFLTMALVAGLTALSNGQQKGWNSNYIHICEALTVVGTVMFVAVELAVRHPLLDLRIFLFRNFSLSILLAIVRSMGLFGSIFLLPLYLQTQMGYPTVRAGVWMMPGALAIAVSMVGAGKLSEHFGTKSLTLWGVALTGGSLLLFGQLDPLSGWTVVVLPQLLRGLGLGLMMAPITAAALNAVPRDELPMASSFLNVAQNVGGALGIALLNNVVTNAIHTHAVNLGGLLTKGESQAFLRLGMDALAINERHAVGMMVTPEIKAAYLAAHELSRHAQTLGYDNGFVFLGVVMLLGLPLALLLKPGKGTPPPEALYGD